jgi:hypothetical protein
LESLAEEAVKRELVSEAKFPASWENTGNYVYPELGGHIHKGKNGVKSVPYGRIPYAS